MRLLLQTALLWASASMATLVHAAPGEYWQITTKMEMAGMPFAMPSTTLKVCVPKGGERDPRYTADKDCSVTDVKMLGNKSSWKIRCVKNGEVMNGSGEMTGNADKSAGTIRLNGVMEGQKIDMTQTYASERLGGSCDSEELVKKAHSQLCEVGNGDLTQQIYMGRTLLDEKTCPGKKQPFCAAVRGDAGRDARVYAALVESEKSGNGTVAKDCGINMAATTQAICKTFNGNNASTLEPYCPAQAKQYREAQRRQLCEGRSYTARENLTKCLSGDDNPAGNAAGSEAGSTARSTSSPSQTAPAAPAAPNPTEAIIDGAKKLKGLFGF